MTHLQDLQKCDSFDDFSKFIDKFKSSKIGFIKGHSYSAGIGSGKKISGEMVARKLSEIARKEGITEKNIDVVNRVFNKLEDLDKSKYSKKNPFGVFLKAKRNFAALVHFDSLIKSSKMLSSAKQDRLHVQAQVKRNKNKRQS